MAEELVLLTRLFDLVAWLLPKAEHFPKVYRHSVTQRLMNAALDCQEAVFTAQSARDNRRQLALQEADAALNRLRRYLRLAQQWHWLSNGQFEHVSEIGKLLGGWIKQSAR